MRKFSDYKYEAKRSNREFNLTEEQFRDIINKNCYYCDIQPNKYNGIDRIDSSGGYTLNNVQPCCTMCNRLKSDFSIDDFFNKITSIYHHRIATKLFDYAESIS
jgi:hypothetical protein